MQKELEIEVQKNKLKQKKEQFDKERKERFKIYKMISIQKMQIYKK